MINTTVVIHWFNHKAEYKLTFHDLQVHDFFSFESSFLETRRNWKKWHSGIGICECLLCFLKSNCYVSIMWFHMDKSHRYFCYLLKLINTEEKISGAFRNTINICPLKELKSSYGNINEHKYTVNKRYTLMSCSESFAIFSNLAF